jgi:hypothetical protein
MTISYRMLAAIVGVVLLFGVAAAVIVGNDDDDGDNASDTTVPIDRNDDGGVKTEDDEDDDGSTTSTTRASTTTTTAGATTTATTAAPGATTSTTRRPGSTTTTRPGSTTTAPPATTPATTATTSPPVTSPPPTASNVADLGIHSNSSVTNDGRRVTLSIENQGPSEDVDFTLTVNGGGAAVDNVEAGSGFTCNTGGSTVTCTARGVGQGGTVRQVTIDFIVDAACTGQPSLSATVSSSNRTDPAPADNNYVRSLCRAAPNN